MSSFLYQQELPQHALFLPMLREPTVLLSLLNGTRERGELASLPLPFEALDVVV